MSAAMIDMPGLVEAGADPVLADAAVEVAAMLEAYDTVIAEARVLPDDGSVVLVEVDLKDVSPMDWGDGAVEIVIRRPVIRAEPKWHVIRGVPQ